MQIYLVCVFKVRCWLQHQGIPECSSTAYSLSRRICSRSSHLHDDCEQNPILIFQICLPAWVPGPPICLIRKDLSKVAYSRHRYSLERSLFTAFFFRRMGNSSIFSSPSSETYSYSSLTGLFFSSLRFCSDPNRPELVWGFRSLELKHIGGFGAHTNPQNWELQALPCRGELLPGSSQVRHGEAEPVFVSWQWRPIEPAFLLHLQ